MLLVPKILPRSAFSVPWMVPGGTQLPDRRSLDNWLAVLVINLATFCAI